MNKIDITKKVLGFVGSVGAGTITKQVMAPYMPTRDAATWRRVVAGVGAFGITGAIGRVASREIETSVDELAAFFKTTKVDLKIVQDSGFNIVQN